jgi:hypothetical protein
MSMNETTKTGSGWVELQTLRMLLHEMLPNEENFRRIVREELSCALSHAALGKRKPPPGPQKTLSAARVNGDSDVSKGAEALVNGASKPAEIENGDPLAKMAATATFNAQAAEQDEPPQENAELGPLAQHCPQLAACLHWLHAQHEPEQTGRLFRLSSSSYFQNLCTLIIFLNTCYIFYSTNYEAETLGDETAAMEAIDLIFLLWYVVELSIKIGAHRFYFFWCQDMSWNIFDFILVLVAIFSSVVSAIGSGASMDTTFIRSLRILKVGKALRVFRMVAFFNELRLILNSLLGCVISLFWSIIMLLLVFFMFGVAFVQSSTAWLTDPDNRGSEEGEILKDEFGTVQGAMIALFRSCTGGDDWSYFYFALNETGDMYGLLYLFFIAFANIAFLNIVTALFTERAIMLAQPDRMHIAALKRKKHKEMSEDVGGLCRELDIDGTGKITEAQFRLQMENTESPLRCFFEAGGHDLIDAELFFAMHAKADRAVNLEDFIMGCMKLQGTVSNLDIQVIVWQTQQTYMQMSMRLHELTHHVTSMEDKIAHLKDEETTDAWQI